MTHPTNAMNAAVIKSAEAAHLAPVLAPLELRDVRAETAVLLDAARREADAIRRQAGIDARTRVAEAMELAQRRGNEAGYQAGMAAGRAQGMEQALAESRAAFAADAAKALATLNQINQQWQAGHRQWFIDARHDVIALVLAIARRIVPQLPDLAPDVATENCRTALAAIGRMHELSIVAHPLDLEAIRTLADHSNVLSPSGAAIRYVADESVGRGGVRIESPAGSVDASLATQLDRIADELLDGWWARLNPAATQAPGRAPADARPEAARASDGAADEAGAP